MGYIQDYHKKLCPEDCKYRNKLAPFCGYCLPEIMRELGIRQKKEESNDSTEDRIGQVKT